jgi:hypothetical protein
MITSDLATIRLLENIDRTCREWCTWVRFKHTKLDKPTLGCSQCKITCLCRQKGLSKAQKSNLDDDKWDFHWAPTSLKARLIGWLERVDTCLEVEPLCDAVSNRRTLLKHTGSKVAYSSPVWWPSQMCPCHRDELWVAQCMCPMLRSCQRTYIGLIFRRVGWSLPFCRVSWFECIPTSRSLVIFGFVRDAREVISLYFLDVLTGLSRSYGLTGRFRAYKTQTGAGHLCQQVCLCPKCHEDHPRVASHIFE